MANGPTDGATTPTAPADTGSAGASESTGSSSSTAATSEGSGGGSGTSTTKTESGDDVAKLRSENEDLRKQIAGIVKERNDTKKKANAEGGRASELEQRLAELEAKTKQAEEKAAAYERREKVGKALDQTIAAAKLPEQSRSLARRVLQAYAAEGGLDFATDKPPTDDAIKKLKEEFPNLFEEQTTNTPRLPNVRNGQAPGAGGGGVIDPSTGQRLL